jgi:hypothetical protein
MLKRKFRQESLSPGTPNDRTTVKIPSRVTSGGNCALKQIPKYTGTEMIGISIIHKSCLQPIFNQQAAIDASNMRR